MYVYLYIYVYRYMNTHTHKRTYMYKYIYIYICVCAVFVQESPKARQARRAILPGTPREPQEWLQRQGWELLWMEHQRPFVHLVTGFLCVFELENHHRQ